MPAATNQTSTAANRFALDYRAEAARFCAPTDLDIPTIIDVHTHISGDRAAALYDEARQLYGIGLTYSMTQFASADVVQNRFGDSLRFIAVPDFSAEDRATAFKQGFIDRITDWSKLGARICKFWVAPRGRDYGKEIGEPDLLTLDSPWRRKQMDHAASLGMMFMCHVADPDTWFSAKYSDADYYGTKAQQYEPLERLVDQYQGIPWILAHMGGWPEDLGFLNGLLQRHDNIHLDTSATKWMVRELSKHDSSDVRTFMERWSGRIFFGTDIVTSETHVGVEADGRPSMNADVCTPADAFDLYASRYWALRTLFETSHTGESPIADPDLEMVDPDHYDANSAPELTGHSLPKDLLRVLYHDAAHNVLDTWHAAH